MRRIFLIVILALAVLLIVTAATAWFLLRNESFLKSQLGNIVLKQTGRELAVDGSLRLDLGRETTLEAHGIRFQNAEWAEKPDMVSLGRLLVTVDLPSLFDETPIIPHLAIEDCSIFLLKNGAGEANWDVLPEPEAKEEPPPPREGMLVLLEDLQIRNCRLELDAPERERPLVVETEEISLQLNEEGRAQLAGAGSVNEEDLSLSGWLVPVMAFRQGGALEHKLQLRLGDIELSSSGTLDDAATFTGANISTRYSGPEIDQVLKTLALPPLSEGAFDFRLDLNSEGNMTQLNIQGDLGSLDINASGQLDRLKQPRSGAVRFEVTGPNLAALGAAFGVIGLVPEPFSVKGDASYEDGVIKTQPLVMETSEDRIELTGVLGPAPKFADSDFKARIRSNQIGRWDGRVGLPTGMLGTLELDGQFTSDHAGIFSTRAELKHGGGLIKASGELGTLTGLLQPDLEIEAHSPDLQLLGTAAGIDNLPSAPLDLGGHVRISQQEIQLEGVDIDLAGHRTLINGLVRLPDNYSGSKLDVKFESPDVAELGRLFGKEGFPAQPAKLNIQLQPEGKGLSFRMSDGDMGNINLDVDGRIEDLENPLGVDVDFDIRLPRLDALDVLLPEFELPKAPFTARGIVRSSEQEINLEGIELDLAGHQTLINGLVKLPDNYRGSKLDVKFDSPDIAELGRLFGRGDLPAQPVKLNIGLEPQGAGLVFKVSDGNMGDINLEVDGRIEDLENPVGVDANFDIRLPRFDGLALLFPDIELPKVPFTASGSLRNQKNQTQLENVQLQLGQNKASIDGNIKRDRHFQLSIKASGPDASKLEVLVKQPLPPDSFSVETDLTGNPSEIGITNLNARLGKSELGGQLKIGLGETTRISGSLDSPLMDLSWFEPDEESEEPPPPDTPSDYVFDETPVMEFSDHGLDVDMKLNVARIDLGNTEVDEFELGVVLNPNYLEINPFSLRGQSGGKISGMVTLNSREAKPRLNLTIQGEELRLGLLAVEGQDPETFPPMEIDLALNGVGVTRREMASSLNGKIRIYQGSGQVASAGVGLLFSDFISELFTLLNPFAKSSEYTNLECSVAAADIVSGQVEVFPVIYHTEQITILSEGKVDLDTEKLDLSFSTKPRTGIGISAGVIINPLVKVGGRLASPAVELDAGGAVVSSGLAVATVGISLLAKSMSDRFLSSKDPCGDARKEIDKKEAAGSK